MSRTINCNLTGKAASQDLRDLREMLNAETSQPVDIATELFNSAKFRNSQKRLNILISQTAKEYKKACVFCSCAVRFHNEEKDALEQLKVYASIERQQQADESKIDIDTWADEIEVEPRKSRADAICEKYEMEHMQWQDEVESTRKTDYPLY